MGSEKAASLPQGKLATRLLWAFLLPTALCLMVIGALGYGVARRILEEELGQSLSSLAAATASQVNGERLLSIQPEDDVQETRTWRNMVRLLGEVRQASQLRRIFAVDVDGKLLADAGGALPVGVVVPELSRDRDELRRVFSGERLASQVLFEGSDGRLYKTGYAPVRFEERVVGAIAVEGDAAFFGPLRRLARGFAGLSAVALALLTFVALATAQGLSRPLQRLMDSALRIGRGDLSTQVKPEPTREIGVLARELEVMRGALESRDRQLQMMLAGVAHEVRNPLGGIQLYTGLIAEDLQGEEPAQARAHLSAIEREVRYLQQVVEDFLAFAREQKLQLRALPAEQLLRHAEALLAPEAMARQLKVTALCAPGDVNVDESLVTAALVNLLKNALQAAPEGSEVLLSGRQEGRTFVFEVDNGGTPIPEATQARIFEPFFTTRQQGSGLGLPLAQKIARAHGGTLTLQSSAERTVFNLTLPLA